MKRQPAVLIVPALDEAPVIASTLARIPAGLFLAVIVADNGSTDGTGPIAAAAGARVVTRAEKGYGGACLAAIEAVPAETEVVAFMQADGSEDPREAAELLSPIFDGRADLVLGSRVLGRSSPGALLPHQRFGNWLSTTLIRWIWGHAYTDLGPFRAIRLSSLRAMDMRELAYGWTVEMQVKAVVNGLRVLEIPVTYGIREAGVNKVSGNAKASVMAGARILAVIVRLALRAR